MKTFSFTLLLLFPSSIISFHAYDLLKLHSINESICPAYKDATKPFPDDFVSRLSLWPGLMNDYDKKEGETLYGAQEALEIVHRNQHPTSCSGARFLISGGWPYGFGSRIHMEGAVLGIALHLGMVYMPHPSGDNFFWETDVPFCKGNGRFEPGMNCFYEKYSNCTMEDVLQRTGVGSIDELPKLYMGDFADSFNDRGIRNQLRKSLALRSAAYVVILTYGGQPYDLAKFLPVQLQPLIDCSPMRDDAKHYWWRAVSATYIARPNRLTLELLNRLQTLEIGDYREMVTIFVRHGDKGREMKLLNFQSYATTSQLMWDTGLVPSSHHYIETHRNRAVRLLRSMNGTQNSRIGRQHQRRLIASERYAGDSNTADPDYDPVEGKLEDLNDLRQVVPFNGSLFITTEDPAVIEEAVQYGARSGWKIFYTNLFSRAVQTAFKTWDEQHKKGTVAVHDDLEYMSMLLNLYYSTRSEAWVCTMASNSCRLMDELRATLGGKANRNYADLSIETCPEPPCLAMNEIKNFGE